MRLHLQLIFTAAFLVSTPVSRLAAQNAINRNNFLIEPNRPMVYLRVDHVGLGAQEKDGKSHERVWLELHNNSLLPISVRTSGAPLGDSKGSTGVMVILVPADYPMGITVSTDHPPVNGNEDSSPKDMPSSSWFEVGSIATITSGKSLLFSLPADHFSKRWHIHIPFEFALPPGKGPRDDAAWGGTTEMFLSYSFHDLPESVRKLLHSALGQNPK
jgi:hypothetical protein